MIKIDSFKEFLLYNNSFLSVPGIGNGKEDFLKLSMYKECNLKKEWIKFLKILSDQGYKDLNFDLRSNNLSSWFTTRLIASINSLKTPIDMIRIDLRENYLPFKAARETILYFQKQFFPSQQIIISTNKKKQHAPDSIVLSCGYIQLSSTLQGMCSFKMGESNRIIILQISEDEKVVETILESMNNLIKKESRQLIVDFKMNNTVFGKIFNNLTFANTVLEIQYEDKIYHQSRFLKTFPYESFSKMHLYNNKGIELLSKYQQKFKSNSISKFDNINSLEVTLKTLLERLNNTNNSIEGTKLKKNFFEASSNNEENIILEVLIPASCQFQGKVYLHFLKATDRLKLEKIMTIKKNQIEYGQDEKYKIYINFKNDDFIKKVLEKIAYLFKLQVKRGLSLFTISLTYFPFKQDQNYKINKFSVYSQSKSIQDSKRDILESLKSTSIQEMPISKITIKQRVDLFEHYDQSFEAFALIKQVKEIKFEASDRIAFQICNCLLIHMRKITHDNSFSKLRLTFLSARHTNKNNLFISFHRISRVVKIRVDEYYDTYYKYMFLKAPHLIQYQIRYSGSGCACDDFYNYADNDEDYEYEMGNSFNFFGYL